MADEPPDPIPDQMFEAAATWLVRLREPLATPQDRADFAGWLAADARHPAAMDRAARLWGRLAEPAMALAAASRPAANPGQRTIRRPGWRPGWRHAGTWAAAAALLLAVAIGVVQGPALYDDLRADHRTPVGERRTVELADGSRLTLNTGTALAIDLAGDGRRVRLFRGEAFFDVAADPDRPFLVDTAAGSVRVVGTRFNVRLDGARAVVAVEEGRVVARGAGPDGAEVALARGQQVLLSADAPPVAAPLDGEQAGEWRSGRLVFFRTPLAEVTAELERYRGGRIVPLGNRLRALRVTGAFDTGRPDAALDVIAATLAVDLTRLPFGIVLLR
ncbi:FecR family protein [Stella humosa]|uniref:FecR family protein n=1 Tax=Stella humosa TaxID=94 RepID=A0A3N1LIV7_9PROT|nr:FecR family protein [Stella humosa]ROP90768.1 FecR family protein [Stella humosa]BBK34886.1 iron dicitrate transporter FecR [Stella humosa]